MTTDLLRRYGRGPRGRRVGGHESFLVYVEQILVRTLRPGDIVVLDNLSAYRSDDIRLAIVGARATGMSALCPQW